MKPLRTALSGVVAAAAVVALLAGCAGTTEKSAAPLKPVSGGTFVYDTDVEPFNFDPQANADMSNQVISANIFDNLVYHGSDGKFYPWLAKSWTVSPDGLTYTFTLRDDVKFHDGEKFNAAAVKANFDRGSKNSLTGTAFGSIALRGGVAKVVDDYTFQLVLQKPYAPTLDDLSFPGTAIIAPSQLTPEGLTALSAGGTALIGTGPFEVVSYTKGSNLVLKRNPDYEWGPGNTKHRGPAYLSGIEFRFVPEEGNRLGALTSGQVDGITQVPTSSVASIRKNSKLQIQTNQASGLPYSLELNSAKGPFADKNVREAFKTGIDIDGLLKAVYNGTATRAWSIITNPSAPVGSADTSLKNSWKYDLASAKDILDKAGWSTVDSDGYRTKDGKRLTATWLVRAPNIRDQRDVLAQGIQAEAKKLGIEITIDPVDNGTYFSRLKANDYDLSDTSLTRADAYITSIVLSSKYLASTGGYNWANINDPEVDKLIDTNLSATDDSVRVDTFKKLQQLNNEEDWIIPLNVLQYRIGSASYVKGITFQLGGFPLFYNTWLNGKKG